MRSRASAALTLLAALWLLRAFPLSAQSAADPDWARLEDLSLKAELATVYPEATPVNAIRSAFAYA